MESITSIKMFQKSEYKENGKIIRWTEVCMMDSYKYQHPVSPSRLATKLCIHANFFFFVEVFFLQRGQNPKRGATDSAEHNRLTERIARAFCLALCPHLKLLKEDGMAKLGLRVTFDTQEVNEILRQIFQAAVNLYP